MARAYLKDEAEEVFGDLVLVQSNQKASRKLDASIPPKLWARIPKEITVTRTSPRIAQPLQSRAIASVTVTDMSRWSPVVGSIWTSPEVKREEMSLPSAPAPPSSIEILAQASTAEPRNDSTSAGSRANSEFKSQKLSGSQRSLQLIGNALDAPSTIEASIYGGGAETDGGLDTVLDSSSIPVSPRVSIDAEIYQLTDPSVLFDWYKSRLVLHSITKATNHCPAEMFLCEGMHRKRLENNEDLLENPDRAKLVRNFGNPTLYSGYASKCTTCKTDSLNFEITAER